MYNVMIFAISIIAGLSAFTSAIKIEAMIIGSAFFKLDFDLNEAELNLKIAVISLNILLAIDYLF